MSRMVGVPADQVVSIWPDVEPFVSRCFAKVKEERWEPVDVLYALTDRDMQLWISVSDNGLESILVTRLVCYPRAKECELFIWAGKIEEESMQQLDVIEKWAAEQGCHFMSSFSRPGSAKLIGYEKGLIRTYRRL